jgi:hypothetical protein
MFSSPESVIQIHNDIKASASPMFDNFSYYFAEDIINGFQRKIQETQKATSESQFGKIDETMTETYKFRKRGNDEQYIHNQKVFVKMREVNAEILLEDVHNDIKASASPMFDNFSYYFAEDITVSDQIHNFCNLSFGAVS